MGVKVTCSVYKSKNIMRIEDTRLAKNTVIDGPHTRETVDMGITGSMYL